jgi:hypothetical protein
VQANASGSTVNGNQIIGNNVVGLGTTYGHGVDMANYSGTLASTTIALNTFGSGGVTSLNVGIGTSTTPYATLQVWGPDTASSTLSAIASLDPVLFNWVNPNMGSGPQVGFIAQEVQHVFPFLVSTTSPTSLTPDGTLGVNYIGFIAPIVKAIQALATEVHTIEQTIAGFAQSLTTNRLCVNKSDGTPVCVTGDQLASVIAAANQSGTGASGTGSSTPPPISSNGATASSSADSSATPPMLQVNGDTPAYIPGRPCGRPSLRACAMPALTRLRGPAARRRQIESLAEGDKANL